jgi:hypothetical protein
MKIFLLAVACDTTMLRYHEDAAILKLLRYSPI